MEAERYEVGTKVEVEIVYLQSIDKDTFQDQKTLIARQGK
jgi:hypothetical protein